MRNLTKEFSYNNCNYHFETLRFREVIKKKLTELSVSGNKKSRQDLFEDIADKKGISSSAINHWYNGHNAPVEIEKLQDIAEYLKIEWETFFMKEQVSEGENIMVNTEMIQKVEAKVQMPLANTEVNYSDEREVIRDIYHAMVDYIEKFRETTAFHYDEESIDYTEIDGYDLFDALYEADKKCKAIMKKVKKAMFDIPYEVYHNLSKFVKGYLTECLGDDMHDIWELEPFTDEELVAMGHDLSTMNPYGRKFEGYTTYCERNELEDDISARMQYVNHIADNAYVILEDILQMYIKKIKDLIIGLVMV